MSDYTIVVGLDGSEGSRRAVQWVADLAARLGATVCAVHTFEPLSHLSEVEPPYDFDAMEADARRRLESEWAEPLAGSGVSHEVRVVHGAPFQCLIDVADEVDADLIVVGARGLGRLKSLALGSTSGKLLHLSHRPVTIVPPAEGR